MLPSVVCCARLACTCREILEAELGEYSAHKGIKVVCAWDAQQRVSTPSEGAAKPSTVRWVLPASSHKRFSPRSSVGCCCYTRITFWREGCLPSGGNLDFRHCWSCDCAHDICLAVDFSALAHNQGHVPQFPAMWRWWPGFVSKQYIAQFAEALLAQHRVSNPSEGNVKPSTVQ